MSDKQCFLAMDFGAESGRGELVTLCDGKVTLKEIHRFPNRPVRMGHTLHWDLPFLMGETLESLKACARDGISLTSIGVDTWGVDFGLLGEDGTLLGNPVHYRDTRTNDIHQYSDPIMSRSDIFAATGYEPWQISSLFQLLSMKRDGSKLLEIADTFLNIPDLMNYFLTGVKASEMSIVNTSNLMSVDCNWCSDIITRFSLPDMFHNMIQPATVLGELQPSVADLAGIGGVPVVSVCGHDTSAALAAVPAQGDNWAFLSCGTWSILGFMVDKPVATDECLNLGFTNEYTIGGWYLARNISGLWLVQELKRKWDVPNDPWDYSRITAAAADVNPASWSSHIDAAHESLMAPADMEQALYDLIARSGQTTPENRGHLVRCVLESLALEYNRRLTTACELAGKKPDALYMVGGGIANKLLCQFTADACNMPVYAGVDQCTAVGNALGQALAMGIVKSPEEMRQVSRDSFNLDTYEPQDQSRWDDLRAKYAKLTA